MEALHAKLAWSVLDSSSLFASFMRAKYILDNHVSLSSNSAIWKAIQGGWGFISENSELNASLGRHIWKPDSKGIFPTSSAWIKARNSACSWSAAAYVWKSYIPLKMEVVV